MTFERLQALNDEKHMDGCNHVVTFLILLELANLTSAPTYHICVFNPVLRFGLGFTGVISGPSTSVFLDLFPISDSITSLFGEPVVICSRHVLERNHGHHSPILCNYSLHTSIT